MSTPPAVTGPTVPPRTAPFPTVRDTTPTAPRHAAARWPQRYAALVCVADLALLGLTVFLGMAIVQSLAGHSWPQLVAAAVSTVLVVVPSLVVVRVWEPVVLGSGTAEFKRLGQALVGSAVAIALAALALQLDDLVRPWLFGVLPGYAVLAVLQRFVLRGWLHSQRRGQRFLLPVLAVGSYPAVSELIARTRRDPHFGWTITGACTSTGTGPDGAADIDGVPVVGDLEAIPTAVRISGYRVVAVAPGPGWGPRRLHELAWQLEGTRTELAVDPGLMDVAGPRLHLTPVDNMPVVTLSKPRLTGGRRLLKNAFDKVGAAALLSALAVPLLLVAVAVKLDGGTVLRREPRVGESGRLYLMTRFRVTRADDDGRFSRVGRLLERYSIDELPQLFDVLAGTMSLVGPRPPRPIEMDGANVEAMRRLLVRPGMTGLWQVLRDRAHTDWDESIRLDLRYVENWSLILDVVILLRTLRSLVRRARAV